jgi:hypothetical protein
MRCCVLQGVVFLLHRHHVYDSLSACWLAGFLQLGLLDVACPSIFSA